MRFIKKIGVAVAGAAVAVPAIAADDLSSLTSAVDFSAVSTAVLAVAGAMAGIYVLWKGASMILRAIRGL